MALKSIFRMGLMAGVAAITASCGKTITDYQVKGDFYYINRMPQPVRLKLYGNISGAAFNTYDIKAGDTLLLATTGETIEDTTNPRNYVPAITSDTVVVVFNDTVCYKEYGNAKSVMQDIRSYQYTKKGNRHYAFVLPIDSAIRASARRCE